MKKDDREEEMMLKKRRNVNKLGCVRDFNHMCWYIKLRVVESEEIGWGIVRIVTQKCGLDMSDFRTVLEAGRKR